MTYCNDSVHFEDSQLKVDALTARRGTVVETADQGQITDQTAVVALSGCLYFGDDTATVVKLALVVYRPVKSVSLGKGWIGEVKLESPCVATLARDPVDIARGEQSRRLDCMPQTKRICSGTVLLRCFIESSIRVRLLGRRCPGRRRRRWSMGTLFVPEHA